MTADLPKEDVVEIAATTLESASSAPVSSPSEPPAGTSQSRGETGVPL